MRCCQSTVSFRRFGHFTLALVAIASLTVAGCGNTALVTLDAEQDEGVESSFELDFGQLGGKIRSNVSRTRFQVVVDEANGEARFSRYSQDVAALTLPGGLSTGAITVQIKPGSSSGTFDADTGELATTDTYVISFEGDLSAYGLVSPVELESSSVATVNYESATGGGITLKWNGTGELFSILDTLTPIPFTYSCDVESTFVRGSTVR